LVTLQVSTQGQFPARVLPYFLSKLDYKTIRKNAYSSFFSYLPSMDKLLTNYKLLLPTISEGLVSLFSQMCFITTFAHLCMPIRDKLQSGNLTLNQSKG
jgi:hypothetical protein